MKKTADGRYISDSIYKIFAYLYDFRSAVGAERTVKAVLVVPSGISAVLGAPTDRTVFIASGDDRAGMAQAMRDALTA